MIELIATAESLEQGLALLEAGVDCLVVGEADYGLRLPGYLSFEEMGELVEIAHSKDKKVAIDASAILHNDKINRARDFLKKAKATGADLLVVGDTGLIQILKEEEYSMPYIYDASVLVTSSGQVNFWAKYGAVMAKVAMEVPYVELIDMAAGSQLPLIYQVYGASCIHQSGRRLLDNYFNFIGKDLSELSEHDLNLSVPKEDDTHYSIFQDSHGTHIFANNDLNLMTELEKLHQIAIDKWYLDGIYCPGQNFVEIARCFGEARDLITSDHLTNTQLEQLNEKVKQLHPNNRDLSLGFFEYDRETVQ
ncbi:peptidase U32 family protein [Hutsoniella sourekii]|uniref:peptidase U32 family protein n=1 Tax=Hutsoniella sourekii TaxID=87650 RepID=UPI0004829E66|nr:peptidase U32 family protein [Hutsoniella sourekii]